MLYRTDPVLSQAQQIIYHPLSGKVLASLVFEKRHPIVVLLIHCHLKHNKEPSSFFACILAFVKQSVCFSAAPHFAHFPPVFPHFPHHCVVPSCPAFQRLNKARPHFPTPIPYIRIFQHFSFLAWHQLRTGFSSAAPSFPFMQSVFQYNSAVFLFRRRFSLIFSYSSSTNLCVSIVNCIRFLSPFHFTLFGFLHLVSTAYSLHISLFILLDVHFPCTVKMKCYWYLSSAYTNQ